jgi:peptidoglycan/xylan/chitin deacetylase (PgdA/CDA1 family)
VAPPSRGLGTGAGRGPGAVRRLAIAAITATRLRPAVDRVLGSVVAARPGRPEVAVTFDDGPHPAMTRAVLDVLDGHGARCTFFVVVERAEEHRALVGELLDRGHEVGLHGATHRRLTAPIGTVVDEIRRAKDRLEAVTGRPVRWFRPPYGVQTVRSFAVARASGLEVVTWTADLADWARPVAAAPETVAGTAGDEPLTINGDFGPGSIVLLHDVPNGFAAEHVEIEAKGRLVTGLLDRIAADGLRPVTLTELVDANGPVRAPKFRPRGPEPAIAAPSSADG